MGGLGHNLEELIHLMINQLLQLGGVPGPPLGIDKLPEQQRNRHIHFTFTDKFVGL